MFAKKYKSFLMFLADLTTNQLKALVKTLTRHQVSAIREVALNVIKGNVNLSPETRKSLSPYKKFLRELAYKGVARCKLSRRCRALLKILKASKEVIAQLD